MFESNIWKCELQLDLKRIYRSKDTAATLIVNHSEMMMDWWMSRCRVVIDFMQEVGVNLRR